MKEGDVGTFHDCHLRLQDIEEVLYPAFGIFLWEGAAMRMRRGTGKGCMTEVSERAWECRRECPLKAAV